MKRLYTIMGIILVLNATGFAQNMLGRKFKQKNYIKFSPLSDSLRKERKIPIMKQHKSFHKFNSKHSNSWKVRYSPRTALPEAIVGGKTARYKGSAKSAAEQFINENNEMLRVDFSRLKLSHLKKAFGVTHLLYDEIYNGIPVEFSYVKVHINDLGEVVGYQSKYEPEISLSPIPSINAAFANNIVATDLRGKPKASAKLVYFPDEKDGSIKLAWKIRARGSKINPGSWVYYIDANNGAVLFKYDDLRYVCPGGYTASTGTVNGMVYEISPQPYAYPSDPPFVSQISKPMSNQYIWVQDYSSRTMVNNGEYCSSKSGKVFATLKGPYFSVVDFRGASANFNNGSGAWATMVSAAESPHPYENERTYTYSLSIDPVPSGFAMAMPNFSSFNVGEMDLYSDIIDGDMLYVKDGAGKVIANYIGQRTNSFLGAPVENPDYSIFLKTDKTGTYNGFKVDVSSYMYLTDSPSVSNNATGSILWSAAITSNTTSDQVNAFYHLNKIRSYFDLINRDPYNANDPAANLNGHLPVMVHAHGQADDMASLGGMLNAFYDSDNNAIVFGDGPLDYDGYYRSFALDGTIVRHEYIHYVNDRIYPVVNFGEFGAISEALADYFSLASFKNEGLNIDKLGNYIGAGEGSVRTLIGTNKMPDDWAGQVHDDSLILSQALWDLRKGANDLGATGNANFPGAHRADLFTFVSLFYFPDNFANFYDAMITVCKQLEPAACDSSMQSKITTAFALHGIAGAQSGGDDYENNNGPESATDAGSLKSLSASIYPVGDVDYYSLPLNSGNFTAKLNLPSTNQDGIYYSYALFLFDANRNYITDVYPETYGGGACPDAGDCQTLSPSVTLNYPISSAGRYYLVVAGAPNQYYGNSQTNSSSLYNLSFSYSPEGSAQANIFSTSFDNDEISFEVPHTLFNMVSHPSSSTLTSAETIFKYARLLDHNKAPLTDTRTDITGSYMSLVGGTLGTGNYLGVDRITGKVRINQGFEKRYPGAGAVYLEIFGINRIGQIVSLGVSNVLHLTAGKNDAVAYNNVLCSDANNPRCSTNAIIKYDLLTGGHLSIKAYTSNGTLVKTLVNANCPAGKGTAEWNGLNSLGQGIASGVYFIKINGPGIDKIEKIAVVN